MGKRLSYAVVSLSMVAMTVDYALMMPTMWHLLQRLDPTVGEWFLGLSLSAMGFASVCFSPLVGLWLDKRDSMKEVMVAQLWVAVLGNAAYAAAPNKWFLLAARFVTGLGFTVGLSCNVYVIRITSEEERSAAFARLNALMVLGMIFGPALNFPISFFPSLSLWGYQLDALSAPGLVMVVVLLLLLIAVHLWFEEPEKKKAVDDSPGPEPGSAASSICKRSIVALILCQFIALFSQTSYEAVLTPITSQYFGFNPVTTSLFYAGLTVEILIVFILTSFVVQRIQDRTTILLGWIFSLAGSTFMVVVSWQGMDNLRFWEFCVGVGIVGISYPLFESTVSSLFSKLIKANHLQGRGQSILGTSQSLATVVGPLVSGALLTLGFQIVATLMISLGSITFLFFLLSYSSLDVPTASSLASVNGEDVSAEREQMTETEPLVTPSGSDVEESTSVKLRM